MNVNLRKVQSDFVTISDTKLSLARANQETISMIDDCEGKCYTVISEQEAGVPAA